VAGDDLSQPFTLDGDRLVHSIPQLCLDILKLRPQTVATGLPFEQEVPPA
jgi:hypothetical protein